VTLLFAAAKTPAWRESLMLIKPETILSWHRQGFRLFWRMKSRRGQRRPRIPAETIALIKQMARENNFGVPSSGQSFPNDTPYRLTTFTPRRDPCVSTPLEGILLLTLWPNFRS
jgi:hypothetical protein